MQMKIKARFVLDAIALIVFLVAMNTALTGIPVHEWLSVLLGVIVLIHLLTEWDWTVHVVIRFFRRLARLARLNLVLDILLFVLFALVMLSGFLVSQSIAPMLGLHVPFGPTWRIIHAMSADAALMVLGLHVGLHWRWFVRAFKRVVAAPVAPETTN
jgi:hypothetical protein